MTEGRGASPASTSGPLNGEISLFGLSRLLVVRARANSTDGTEQEGRKVVALEREFKDPLWQALIASWPTLNRMKDARFPGLRGGLRSFTGATAPRRSQSLTAGRRCPPASGSARPTAWALAWPQAQAGTRGPGKPRGHSDQGGRRGAGRADAAWAWTAWTGF